MPRRRRNPNQRPNRPDEPKRPKRKAEGSTGNHPGRKPGKQKPSVKALRQRNQRLRKQNRRYRQADRAMRRRQTDVTDPLTPRRLNREVDASMDVRYNPEIRGLKGQVRGSVHRSETEIPAWYQQYQAQQRQAEARTAGYFQGAQAQLGQAAQQGLQQQTGQMQQAQAQAQQQAQVRGSQAETAPFAQGIQAAGAGYAQNVGEAGAIGSSGARQAGYMAQMQLVGAQKMMEALGQERNERSKLRGEIRGVRRERGAASVDLRRELRGEERNWRAVAQEFGLDQAKLQTDAADEAAKRRQDRRENRQERREKRRDFKADRRDEKVDRRKDRKDFRADRRDERRRRQEEDRDFAADRSDEAFDRADKGSSSSGGGGSGGTRHQGRKTNVTPSEAQGNKVSWRKYVRMAEANKKPPSSADSFVTGAVGDYVRAKNSPNTTRGVSAKQARILWRDYGIRVPVRKSTLNSKRRTVRGPKGQGARPT